MSKLSVMACGSFVLALSRVASAQAPAEPLPAPPPEAAPASPPEPPAPPKLRFFTNQPGVSFHYAKLARPNPDFVPTEWTRLCLGDCEATLPSGSYRLALSLGAGEPVLAPQLLELGRAQRLEGTYSDNTQRRAAGWVILGVGGATSVSSMTMGALLAGRPSTERLGVATLAGGAVGLLVSLIFGIPLATTPDRAEVLRENSPR